MRHAITSGSRVSASTVDLDDLAARVQQVASQCHERALSLEGAAQLMAVEWHPRAQAVAVQVAQISRDLQGVSNGLRSTSEAYSRQEALAAAAAHEVSSTLFWGLGRLLATVAPVAIPAVIGGVAALLTAWTLAGKRPEEILSTPAFVTGLGHVVSGLDDFAAGLVGIPLPVMAALGERGLGLSGPSAIAGALVAGAGVGSGFGAGTPGLGGTKPLLVDTPVTVTRVSVEAGRAPTGVEDLLERIPRANPDMPQMRIERYEPADGGNATFIVYLGGTIDAALMATDEPWDMTSNVAALANSDAGSYRAALAAMTAAGIASDDLVTLVGHSQGGLLAARISESEEFTVGDVVTVGAPIRQVPVPVGVTVTAIEHNEDLVPTLGGLAVGATVLGSLASSGFASGGLASGGLASGGAERGAPASGTTTTVRRSALEGRVSTASDPLPGHNLSRYVETGRVIDNSADAQLTELRSRIAAHSRGAAEVTFWRGERVPR